jgi:hypothetical protein
MKIAPLHWTEGEWSASRPGLFSPKGKSPYCPLARRMVGLQIRCGHGGEFCNVTFLKTVMKVTKRERKSKGKRKETKDK